MYFLNFIRITSAVFNRDSLKLSFIQHNFEIFEIEILVFVFLELSFIYYNEQWREDIAPLIIQLAWSRYGQKTVNGLLDLNFWLIFLPEQEPLIFMI